MASLVSLIEESIIEKTYLLRISPCLPAGRLTPLCPPGQRPYRPAAKEGNSRSESSRRVATTSLLQREGRRNLVSDIYIITDSLVTAVGFIKTNDRETHGFSSGRHDRISRSKNVSLNFFCNCQMHCIDHPERQIRKNR